MNLSCFSCGNLFTEWDSVKCDGCERIAHRDTCGVYQLIPAEHGYEGETIAYFFCDACMEEPLEEEEEFYGWWEDE